ncbi:MAG: phytoene/squalene synthase family protein [Hyphomicrobiales bacterium]
MSDYCQDLVRAADKDRFLAALFAPVEKRPLLMALYAFNLEIARVRQAVSEPQLGEIRLQWWLDTLDAIYAGGSAEHPVAEALARAVAAGGLPREALRNLVLAHRFDLYDDPMPSFADLEGYLGETSSALIQMAALILAGPGAQAAAEAAGLAGVAHGLAGLLRARPIHRARGQAYLPPGMDLTGAIQHARRRLAEARALRERIPVAALPAFLPASLTDLYLDRLERPGENALTRVAEVSQFRRQLRLWWMARHNAF